MNKNYYLELPEGYKEFYKILSSGCDACEISLIPEYLDCVYVSELKNCRFKK